MPDQPTVLVVVSHYAARPAAALGRLLDSTTTFPAGTPHDTRVVVNRDGGEVVELPPRHRGVEVTYRPNAGYNIGAWEAGWRTGPPYHSYLFLQDECQIVQSDWVGAFARKAAEPGIGLVGECFNPDWDAPWDALVDRFRGDSPPGHTPGGRVQCYLDYFHRLRIPPGGRGDHLQSLVLFATRAVLDGIGGFPACEGYGEAIAAEIGMSKRVQAAGLALARVGPEPFFYVEHPQWVHRRPRPAGAHPPQDVAG